MSSMEKLATKERMGCTRRTREIGRIMDGYKLKENQNNQS
jgi:hypothetical protein